MPIDSSHRSDLLRLTLGVLRQAQAHIRKAAADLIEWQGREPKITLDHALDELIRSRLIATEIPVLSEETDKWPAWYNAGPIWIVDPLDGSLNFLRWLGPSAVSIALWDGERPVFGAILDIVSGEIGWAVTGGSRDCSGPSLRCSSTTNRQNAVLCTGIPSGFDFADERKVADWASLIASYGKVRMVGSAASSLLMVAQGRADAYSEQGIKIWDVAAGIALVEAAGGSWQMEQDHRSHVSVSLQATNGQLQIIPWAKYR